MAEFNARKYFYDWYKILPITIDEETGNKRIEAINVMLQDEDEEFWFDILNVYLKVKLKIKENKEKFVQEFHQKDATFPLSKNENLLQTLAAISLCILLDEQVNRLNDKLAYAILNCNFFGQLKPNNKIPVSEYALKYLQREGDRINKEQLSSDKAELEILQELDIELSETNRVLANAETLSIIKSINTLYQSNLLLKEELDVLWWLMGEHSINGEESFSKLGLLPMVAFAAKDLSELTLISQSLKSAKSFLSRVLRLSNNGKSCEIKSNIFDIAKTLNGPQLNLLAMDDNISVHTPCLFILSKMKDSKITEDLKSTLNESIGFDISKSFGVLELSHQLYEEYIYLKLF